MERAANDIIDMLTKRNIFKTGIPIEKKIYSDVPKFLNLLITFFYTHEIFHGHINVHYTVWKDIINDRFANLLDAYNKEYEINRNNINDRRSKMINFASEIDAQNLMSELDDMSLDPSVSSLVKALKKGGISKKRRPRR